MIKQCPIKSNVWEDCTKYCAWWIESEQKCAIAVIAEREVKK